MGIIQCIFTTNRSNSLLCSSQYRSSVLTCRTAFTLHWLIVVSQTEDFLCVGSVKVYSTILSSAPKPYFYSLLFLWFWKLHSSQATSNFHERDSTPNLGGFKHYRESLHIFFLWKFELITVLTPYHFAFILLFTAYTTSYCKVYLSHSSV